MIMAEEKKQSAPPDEISLKELILKLQAGYCYLRSKWLIILIAGILGGGFGLLYSILKKPQYIATLTFALEEKDQGSQLGAYAGIASQFGINLGGGVTGGAFSGDNIMDLMKSRLMVTKALLSGVAIQGKTESLANYYIGFNQWQKKWERSPALANISFPVQVDPDSLSFTQDSLMGGFYNQITKKNLSIDKVDKNSSIIRVTFKSSNELFAQHFTEALVKNVSLFYVQTKTKRSSANVDILQNRLDSVRQAYNGALYSTATSIDQNMDPIRAIVNVPRISNQSKAQILGAEYAELTKNLEMAKMILLQETPLVQVIDKPVLPLEKKKISKLKALVLGGVLGGGVLIILLVIRNMLRQLLE